VLRVQGKYEEAEEVHRRGLAGYGKALRADHLNTLTKVDNLTAVLQGRGKYEDAEEEMSRRSSCGYEKDPGADHPNTLTCVS
jgi:hypothetical protein